MTLDSHLLLSGLFIFSRATAMLLSAPIAGNLVPATIRVMFGLVLSLSLTPVLQGSIMANPATVGHLVAMVSYEAFVGLLIGGSLQLLVAAGQMAGQFVDIQIGTGSAQLFNPYFGGSASPVAQLKMMLTTVLILLLNGHRMMIGAFAASYGSHSMDPGTVQQGLLPLLTKLGSVSLQMAAPVVAVTVVIDLAAGVVNKAVPQTQPFLVSLPAKLSAGLVALSLGMPAVVVAVENGLDIVFRQLGVMFKGG